MQQVVISADSHVMEPADLWTGRLDKTWRDQAPQVRKNDGAPGYSFHAPGTSAVAGVGGVGCGAQRRGAARSTSRTPATSRPGPRDGIRPSG